MAPLLSDVNNKFIGRIPPFVIRILRFVRAFAHRAIIRATLLSQ